jgi:CO/xanthine dehydrogenase FAD-binding subunit
LPSFELYSPTSLEDALEFLQSSAEASVMASGTDLLPRVRKRQVSPTVILNISALEAELRYIRRDNGVVHIGALTTVSDLMDSTLFADRLSLVHEAAQIFGAPQIRNMATVGGNLCSASSSEDLITVFLALDSQVKLISSEGERSVPLRDFVIEKRRTTMKPSEVMSEVCFGYPKENSWTAFEKLGRRNMLIVAMVNEALALSLEDDMTTVKSARVALNRVAGRIPALAEKTGEFLTGRKLSDETTEKAQSVLTSELKLTGDFRGSAAYRVEVARAYLKRLIQRCSTNIRGLA